MTLLEHIELFNCIEWTPEVCNICSKLNAKHSKLECPLYEKCNRCRGMGSYRYCNTHTCYAPKEGALITTIDINDCNYNLYWNGKD